MPPRKPKLAGRPSASNAASSLKVKLPSISERLAEASPITPAEAFAKLLKLEKRPLPTEKATIAKHPRCSCFDTGRGDLESSWVAHQMCERCVLLNQIMHGDFDRAQIEAVDLKICTLVATANNPTSAAYETLLGLSLLTTDCISETSDCYGEPLKAAHDDQILPTLPLSLWQAVAQDAVARGISREFIQPSRRNLVRALMYTSSVSRLYTVEALPPFILTEIDRVKRSPIAIPFPLALYLMQMVNFWMSDATIKRYRHPEPILPHYAAYLHTASGERAAVVTFSVSIETGPLPLVDCNSLRDLRNRKEAWTKLKFESYEASIRLSYAGISVKHACTALRQALEKAGPGPRFANAFLRTRVLLLEEQYSGSIEIVMMLDDNPKGTKSWLFAMSSAR